MTICSLCRSIPLENLPELPLSYQNGSPTWKYLHPFLHLDEFELENQDGFKLEDPIGYPHQPSIIALDGSAKKCGICKLILAAAHNVMYDLNISDLQMRKVGQALYKRPNFKFWITARRNKGQGFLVFSSTQSNKLIYLIASVGVCVQEGDPLECIIPGRPINSQPVDDKVLNRAIHWVKSCEEHVKCKQTESRLPTRVVDIGSNNSEMSLKIRETDEETGYYIALSHCWGTGVQYKTLVSNMQERMSKIIYEELPRNFQDAITVARAFQVRYIWIDSICICQDDEKDWQVQSATMASIYSQAYLTIVASRASETSAGFLTARTDTPKYVVSDYKSKEGFSGQLLAYSIPVRDEAMNTYLVMEKEPLMSRGWCLQERFLSLRLLHFASDQMYFECNEGFTSENGLTLKERFPPLLYQPGIGGEPSRPKRCVEDIVLRRWEQFIRHYSQLSLTKASDKLPAISGVAETFSRDLNDQYIAGLWRGSLIRGLVWTGLQTLPGPTEYRAPSWSWAAYNCTPAMALNPGWQPVARVVDVSVTLKGLNLFGEVKSAWIKLRAPLEPLILQPKLDPQAASSLRNYYRKPKVRTRQGDLKGVFTNFDISFDGETGLENSLALLERLKDVQLFALVLAIEYYQDEQFGCHSLIVRQTDTGLTMIRLGYVMIPDDPGLRKNLQAESKWQTITLV